MPTCEICGRKTDHLYKIRVEGAEMLVCKECAKYGEIIGEVKEKKKVKISKPKVSVEKEETVVPDYFKIIRKEREKLGMTQEDMAKKLKMKESLYRKIEEGKMEPTLDLAKRIERELNVKLTEEISTEKVKTKANEEILTLGDVVTIRKRNK